MHSITYFLSNREGENTALLFLQYKLINEFILLRFDFLKSFIFYSVPAKQTIIVSHIVEKYRAQTYN